MFGRDGYFAHKHTLETDPKVVEDEVVKLLGATPSAGDLTPSAAPIDFHVTLHPADPFLKQNQRGQQPTFQRGEVFTVVVEGRPKPSYHTYPITQRTARQSAGALSRWQLAETPGLRPLCPVTESKPAFRQERTKDVLLEFVGPFTWSRDILVLPEARPGKTDLPFTIQLTACEESICTPGRYPSSFPSPSAMERRFLCRRPYGSGWKLPSRLQPCLPLPTISSAPASTASIARSRHPRSRTQPTAACWD